jgi:hypothetical protein
MRSKTRQEREKRTGENARMKQYKNKEREIKHEKIVGG